MIYSQMGTRRRKVAGCRKLACDADGDFSLRHVLCLLLLTLGAARERRRCWCVNRSTDRRTLPSSFLAPRQIKRNAVLPRMNASNGDRKREKTKENKKGHPKRPRCFENKLSFFSSSSTFLRQFRKLLWTEAKNLDGWRRKESNSGGDHTVIADRPDKEAPRWLLLLWPSPPPLSTSVMWIIVVTPDCWNRYLLADVWAYAYTCGFSERKEDDPVDSDLVCRWAVLLYATSGHY